MPDYSFESTAYPGATEEICIPILEKITNLKQIKVFTADIVQKELIQGINIINSLQ